MVLVVRPLPSVHLLDFVWFEITRPDPRLSEMARALRSGHEPPDRDLGGHDRLHVKDRSACDPIERLARLRRALEVVGRVANVKVGEGPVVGHDEKAPVLAGQPRVKSGRAELIVDQRAETVATYEGGHVARVSEE